MHLRSFSVAASLAVLAFASSAAVAQRKDAALPPAVERNAPSSAVNTFQFFPPVDNTFRIQPRRPENPAEFPDYGSETNDLPTGRLLADRRIGSEALFPGMDGTGWLPADPDIAVGPNHIVQVVNSSIAIIDRSDNKIKWQQTSPNFFSGLGAGTFQFDPKVLYDRVHDRFAMIFLEQDSNPQVSKILFAISDDGDPNGTWHRYRLEAKSGSAWLDYPGWGYNKDGYVVSGNMFGFSTGFYGVQFITIPYADVSNGGSVTTTHLFDSAGASAQMAEMIDGSATNVYGVSHRSSTSLRLYSLTDIGGTASGVLTDLTVPSASSPTMDAESTNGNTLDSIDRRVFTATYRDGSLVTGHNQQSGSFVGGRWYEVNMNSWPSGTPSLAQSGDIASTEFHYNMIAVNINANGDIGAMFTGSNSSTAADVVVTGRVPSDPAGMMGAPTVLEASAGTNYTYNRWGDYFDVDVDPNDDVTFYGVAMTIATVNNWQTKIHSWTVTSNIPVGLDTLTVNPTEVIGGTDNSVGTVTLTDVAEAGGVTVNLSSSRSEAQVPSSVFIAEGASSADFTITTSAPKKTRDITITATHSGVSRSAILTVKKPPKGGDDGGGGGGGGGGNGNGRGGGKPGG